MGVLQEGEAVDVNSERKHSKKRKRSKAGVVEVEGEGVDVEKTDGGGENEGMGDVSVDKGSKKEKRKKDKSRGSVQGMEDGVQRGSEGLDATSVSEDGSMGEASKKEKRKKDKSRGSNEGEMNDEQTRVEGLGDTSVSEGGRTGDDGSRKEKRKKDRSRKSAGERKNDDVLGGNSASGVVSTDDGSRKEKRKKDKRRGSTEEQEKHEVTRTEGLADVSVPKGARTHDDGSKKEKKKKDKTRASAEVENSHDVADVLGDISESVVGSADNGFRKEKRKKEKRKGSTEGQMNDEPAEVLGDSSGAEVDNGLNKEKRKKDKNRGTAEIEKKERKVGDEGGIEEMLEASDGVSSLHMGAEEKIHGKDVEDNDGKLREKEQVKKIKKKKKDKTVVESNETDFTDPNDVAHCDGLVENQNVHEVTESVEPVKDKKLKKRKKIQEDVDSSEGKKKKKRKVSQEDTDSAEGEKEAGVDAGASETNEGIDAAEPSRKTDPKKKSRKVQFSDDVEVFELSENSSEGKESNTKDGKRFSPSEDVLIRNAVLRYVDDHQLGEDGVNMVMKCGQHKELKNCWKEIGEALPWRKHQSVYYRAHTLFERAESRKWTQEELETVRQFHAKHGADWRTLADELGKHRVHVKDAYRRIKLPNMKKGKWSQEEYQNLFDLVNTDLRMKAFMEKKSKHGMLRDNIAWEAISQKLTTRTDPVCCQKWYNQLTSPLVKEGVWADTDDYRLLMALVDLDATCEEDVDWDELVEHRSGDVCRKRWSEMVRHIGVHGTKSFSDQVDTLSQRYCPDLVEAREAYANKPAVD